MIYYVAGVPYSDDLYHSGVKGMKWGVRRYQNYDRTLTPLGKIHYGASKAGKAVGKAAIATGKAVGRAAAATGREIGSVAKRAGAGIKRKIKSKHRWLMTEEDFKEYTDRLNLETSYSEAKKRANANKMSTKVKGILLSSLEKGAGKLAESTMQEFGKEMGKKLSKSKDEKRIEKLNNELETTNKKIAIDKSKNALSNREYERTSEDYKAKASEKRARADYTRASTDLRSAIKDSKDTKAKASKAAKGKTGKK